MKLRTSAQLHRHCSGVRGRSQRNARRPLPEGAEGSDHRCDKDPSENRIWPSRPGTPLSEAFPYDHIIASTEQSLRNLNVVTIDILQLHVWNDDWADQDEWKRAFAKLKEQGKVRHFGISINDHQPSNGVLAAATGLSTHSR